MIQNYNVLPSIIDGVLKQQQNEADTNVTIVFVAPNTDGLCAARILLHLLERSKVLYSLLPVKDEADLRQRAKLLAEETSIRAAFLVNCGASIDSSTIFGQSEDVTVILLDSRRPWHISNVHAENVISVGDEQIDVQNAPARETWLSYRRLLSELGANAADNVDDSDSESESDEGSDSDDEDESGLAAGQKRYRKKADDDAKLPLRIVKQYMSSKFYGKASSHIALDAAQAMGFTTPQVCWLAAVGITGMWMNGGLTEIEFGTACLALESAADPSSTAFRYANTDMTLKLQNDPALMLLRKWSLEESLLYSPYTASKMRTYSDAGRNDVLTLLAQMGVKLKDAKQEWNFASPKVRNAIVEKLTAHAETFNLDKITRATFIRRERNSSLCDVSASDAVYAVNALLAIGGVHVETDQDGNEDVGTSWEHGFHDAWSAVGDVSGSKFTEGCSKAKLIQRRVVHLARNFSEQRSLRPFKGGLLGKFDASGDNGIFMQPQALFWLARFIRATSTKPIQVVLAAVDNLAQDALIVGVAAPKDAGEGGDKHNSLEMCFIDTARFSGVKIEHCSFDAGIMRVPDGKITNIWSFLTAMLTGE